MFGKNAKSKENMTETAILNALRSVALPGADSNIVEDKTLSSMTLRPEGAGFHASIVLEIDPQKAALVEVLQPQVEQRVRAVDGISSVSVVVTAHQGMNKPAPAGPQSKKLELPGIKRIVAVASGKGGVGKSTTAVNLAIAMAMNGLRVGLLDADIYGPSIPRMLKLTGKPETTADKKLIPMQRYGLAAMSMGFLIEEDMPMIWRGPMVHSAIQQLFRDVDWGARDVIIVDMPPGTGDAHLTLAQTIPLAGAVIVSTPQDIALIDARKGLKMFERVNVPVLGIIENMSMFICPHCGGRSDIFGHGGAHAEAEKLGLPFLGGIPLDIHIRETSDSGEPITVSAPDSAIAQSYREVARVLWQALE